MKRSSRPSDAQFALCSLMANTNSNKMQDKLLSHLKADFNLHQYAHMEERGVRTVLFVGEKLPPPAATADPSQAHTPAPPPQDPPPLQKAPSGHKSTFKWKKEAGHSQVLRLYARLPRLFGRFSKLCRAHKGLQHQPSSSFSAQQRPAKSKQRNDPGHSSGVGAGAGQDVEVQRLFESIQEAFEAEAQRQQSIDELSCVIDEIGAEIDSLEERPPQNGAPEEVTQVHSYRLSQRVSLNSTISEESSQDAGGLPCVSLDQDYSSAGGSQAGQDGQCLQGVQGAALDEMIPVVIAFRGTKINKARTIVADLQVLRNANKDLAISKRARRHAQLLVQQLEYQYPGLHFEYYATGHSLGGFLAATATVISEHSACMESSAFCNSKDPQTRQEREQGQEQLGRPRLLWDERSQQRTREQLDMYQQQVQGDTYAQSQQSGNIFDSGSISGRQDGSAEQLAESCPAGASAKEQVGCPRLAVDQAVAINPSDWRPCQEQYAASVKPGDALGAGELLLQPQISLGRKEEPVYSYAAHSNLQQGAAQAQPPFAKPYAQVRRLRLKECVTFESPGLTSYYHSIAQAASHDEPGWERLVTNYVTIPNPINMCNTHLGKVYRIFVNMQRKTDAQHVAKCLVGTSVRWMNWYMAGSFFLFTLQAATAVAPCMVSQLSEGSWSSSMDLVLGCSYALNSMLPAQAVSVAYWTARSASAYLCYRLGATVSGVLKQHSMLNVARAFNFSSGMPCEYAEMQSWPRLAKMRRALGAHLKRGVVSSFVPIQEAEQLLDIFDQDAFLNRQIQKLPGYQEKYSSKAPHPLDQPRHTSASYLSILWQALLQLYQRHLPTLLYSLARSTTDKPVGYQVRNAPWLTCYSSLPAARGRAGSHSLALLRRPRRQAGLRCTASDGSCMQTDSRGIATGIKGQGWSSQGSHSLVGASPSGCCKGGGCQQEPAGNGQSARAYSWTGAALIEQLGDLLPFGGFWSSGKGRQQGGREQSREGLEPEKWQWLHYFGPRQFPQGQAYCTSSECENSSQGQSAKGEISCSCKKCNSLEKAVGECGCCIQLTVDNQGAALAKPSGQDDLCYLVVEKKQEKMDQQSAAQNGAIVSKMLSIDSGQQLIAEACTIEQTSTQLGWRVEQPTGYGDQSRGNGEGVNMASQQDCNNTCDKAVCDSDATCLSSLADDR